MKEKSKNEQVVNYEELERYYKSIPEGFVVVNIPDIDSSMEEWNIKYINPRLAGFMKKSREECMQGTYGSIFSYKDATLRNLYINVAYHGVPMETEIYSSSAKKYFSVTAYQFSVGYFACLVKDITQVRIYRAVVSSTLQAYYEVYYVNLKQDYCQMIYPNYWYSEQVLCYSDEINRKILGNIICDSNYENVAELIGIDNLKKELADKDMVEYRYKRQVDKNIFKWCLVSIVVEERKCTEPISITMMIRDIEDVLKKEMEQQMLIEEALAQAESASRAKGEFLSSMSHEIRTPMNVILGYTSIAQNNINNISKVSDCLEKIKSAGNHLVNLINDILDVSRIENGKISIEQNKADICKLMGDFYNLFAIQASGKKQQLTVDISDIDHTYVYMDWMHINQVLINVVGNAIKYTQECGKIDIKVSEKAHKNKNYSNYIFEVIDNGVGINQKDIPHLFDMYTRGAYDNRAEVEGTGLGLSIAKRIIELMNGSIEVESDAGVGTKFKITIPLRYICDKKQENENQGNNAAKENIKTSSLSDIRIMVVDDNEYNREIASEILRESGGNVIECSNGRQAVEFMENAPEDAVDIILMDVRMPQLDGFETTKLIRKMKNEKKANVPIVAMTANAFDEDKKKALENGMNGHISKPFDIDTFAETVLGYVGAEMTHWKKMNQEKIEP